MRRPAFATSLLAPSARSALPASPIPHPSSSRAWSPSADAARDATEIYSTDAGLAVDPSAPLLAPAPDPATPRAPHPPPPPPSTLRPDNSSPVLTHPAYPSSRDPRPSPAPTSAPPLRTAPPSGSAARTARSRSDPLPHKKTPPPPAPVSLPVFEPHPHNSESPPATSLLRPVPRPLRQSSLRGHLNQ